MASQLDSWNDGAAKHAIEEFVKRVTTPGTDFVSPAARVAVFDNDGTLWCEQPMYFQELFAFDRIKETAEQHPEWKDKEPYKFVLNGDLKAVAAQGEKSLLEIISATHTGMTVEEFHIIVREWMHTARHPRFHRPYDQCIYQPMVEVLTDKATVEITSPRAGTIQRILVPDGTKVPVGKVACQENELSVTCLGT